MAMISWTQMHCAILLFVCMQCVHVWCVYSRDLSVVHMHLESSLLTEAVILLLGQRPGTLAMYGAHLWVEGPSRLSPNLSSLVEDCVSQLPDSGTTSSLTRFNLMLWVTVCVWAQIPASHSLCDFGHIP